MTHWEEDLRHAGIMRSILPEVKALHAIRSRTEWKGQAWRGDLVT